MKLSGNRLKMSDGTIRKFKSKAARNKFEKVALFFKEHPIKARKVFNRKK